MPLGGDLITVLVRKENGNRHRSDDFENAGAGSQISSQDNSSHLAVILRIQSGASRQDNIFAITWSNEKDAAFQVAHGIVGAHPADADILDKVINSFRMIDEFGF